MPASHDASIMVRQQHALGIVTGLHQLQQRLLFFHSGVLAIHAVLTVIP
jgi:hypothetical protein